MEEESNVSRCRNDAPGRSGEAGVDSEGLLFVIVWSDPRPPFHESFARGDLEICIGQHEWTSDQIGQIVTIGYIGDRLDDHSEQEEVAIRVLGLKAWRKLRALTDQGIDNLCL